uniref:Shisa N-terminal domain-containing protein n=1 Tax=Periophthalmus magnuspinnatus TaxID=409849 RepID=A0A3B3ZDS2_9GOBI
MRGKYVFLLGFLLLKLTALVCKADGEPGLLSGFVMIATSNGSREEEVVSASEETPHVEDKCRGYYDVMGQWDPPFICKTGNYLYCCGTCGFRFCCSYKHSRLDQSTCKNYDTPVWMKTGQTPYNKMNKIRDSTKDKTNLIVYIICGVVAIMALVGIFTKLGLEKAHRPQRENMSRAVASVLQGGCPNEQFRGEEGLGMTSQHFVSRTTTLRGLGMGQPQHPYPALGQLAHVYDHQQQQQQQLGKDLNKYASLKAVAAKYNGELYNKRRLMVELPSKGGLPMQPMGNSRQVMSNMTPPMTSNPMTSNPMSSSQITATMGRPFAYNSNTISASHSMGLGIKGWDGTETVGRRKAYGHKRPQCTILEPNQLHGTRGQSRSQHFLPTQPYFVTNSKTEVTV